MKWYKQALKEMNNLKKKWMKPKYKGKTVKLGKPIRTGTDEPGKFKVYVKDPKTGNVKMVRFGPPPRRRQKQRLKNNAYLKI